MVFSVFPMKWRLAALWWLGKRRELAREEKYEAMSSKTEVLTRTKGFLDFV